MSLSAADTRWTDILRILAKVNDGTEYSEKEIEDLTWQEKTKLVQKDQVTCSKTLIIRYKSSSIQFLKAIVSQLESSVTIFTELSFNSVALLISICLFG